MENNTSIVNQQIHIEVTKTEKSIEDSELFRKLNEFIISLSSCCSDNINSGQVINVSECENVENSKELSDYVQSISIDSSNVIDIGNLKETSNIVYHVYKPYDRPSEIEVFENDDDGEEIPATNQWILPSKEFVGLWESLIYEDGLKENIMKFIETSILFGNRNINSHIISCNRIVLLHGPPGTGKTSLCKAIAQKLSIKFASIYKHTHLVEINSHSLFSKWFSESGKLVMKLFSIIKEMILMPKSLVCVLIDEIESLAYARNSISGNEPGDALRVVNAVLTQLDRIKNYPNVLILSTSNLTSSIDIAFIDRSDIKQYIGYPTIKAIYNIFLSAINELKRVHIINNTKNEELLSFEDLTMNNRITLIHTNGMIDDQQLKIQLSTKLLNVAEKSVGLSGRTLRKLPFLAHALYCHDQHHYHKNSSINLETFVQALGLAVDKERQDQKKIDQKHS